MAKKTQTPAETPAPAVVPAVSECSAKSPPSNLVASGDALFLAPLGRKKRRLSNLEVSEVFGMLLQGYGRVYACAALEISYKTFQREMREDPDFAHHVRLCEQFRVQRCEGRLYRLATRDDDSPVVIRATLAYLARRDKIEAMSRARREKRPR